MLDGGVRLIEHCALEAYSVLTRLPPPHRSPDAVVRYFIQARFPEPFLRLSAQAFRAFVRGLSEHDVTGGAAYDALVAARQLSAGQNSPPLTGAPQRSTRATESGRRFLCELNAFARSVLDLKTLKVFITVTDLANKRRHSLSNR